MCLFFDWMVCFGGDVLACDVHMIDNNTTLCFGSNYYIAGNLYLFEDACSKFLQFLQLLCRRCVRRRKERFLDLGFMGWLLIMRCLGLLIQSINNILGLRFWGEDA